jgi:predicted CoA-binding protein
MTYDTCPIPQEKGIDQLEVIHRMLQAQRIAIVGISDDPEKPSFRVAKYLKERGRKEIVPVNPNHQTVLGLKCHGSLEEVPGQIDLVNVFRRPQFCADVMRSAIKKGVKMVWLQQGIHSEEARQLARQAKIDYIEDRCIMVEHMTAI